MSKNLMEKYRNMTIVPVKDSRPVYQTQAGRFIPFMIISYPALNDYLLLVDTDAEAQDMKDSGVEEAIFSRREVEAIKTLTPETVKAHFLLKKSFTNAVIERG